MTRLSPEETDALDPPDPQLQHLDDMAHEAEDRRLVQRLAAVRDRERRFQQGDTVPQEERPDTILQVAHKLMQAGDYGNGPPFPVTCPPPKHFRRKPERAINIETKVAPLTGRGSSAELIRCFRGYQELPCGGCAGAAKEASMDPLVAFSGLSLTPFFKREDRIDERMRSFL